MVDLQEEGSETGETGNASEASELSGTGGRDGRRGAGGLLTSGGRNNGASGQGNAGDGSIGVDGRRLGDSSGLLGAGLVSCLFGLELWRCRTYQSWQMTVEVGMTGLVMVQGQSVMVRVVGSVTV